MKKSTICKAIAMATALGGLGGGLYAPITGAVNLPANSLGEVLIFPYYTTRAGYQTTLSILNTDEENLVAVKLRFYEGFNSRDVLDFNVLLSPGDVFSGSVEERAGVGPVFRRAENDTTCTVPNMPFGNTTANPKVSSGFLTLKAAAYSGNALMPDNSQRANTDGGPTSVDRAREGYVVAIVLGHMPVPTAFPAPVLAAGTPARILTDTVHYVTTNAQYTGKQGVNTEAECVAAQNLFTQAAVRGIAPLFGEPINAIRGNYTLLNVGRGTSVGGNAVALANFATITPIAGQDTITVTQASEPSGIGVGPRPACTVLFTDKFGYGAAPVAWDPNANFAACPNLIGSQVPYWFLEPSLNDAYPVFSLNIDNVVGGTGVGVFGFGSTYGFQAVSELLRARSIVNEWSVNPDLGVQSAWVITHPTKGFFVDRDKFDSPQAAVNTLRFPGTLGPASIPPIAVGGAMAPFAQNFSGANPPATGGRSCNQVGYRLYNRDEVDSSPSQTGVIESPSNPQPNLSLCYETNVIPFDEGNAVFSSVLLPTEISNIYASIETVKNADPTMLKPFGWMRLDLDTDPAATAGRTTLRGPGLPAVGFMLRQRVIPGTSDTYSDISDHSVRR